MLTLGTQQQSLQGDIINDACLGDQFRDCLAFCHECERGILYDLRKFDSSGLIIDYYDYLKEINRTGTAGALRM